MAALSNRKTIRGNALAFVKEWGNETREEAEAKSFWDAFFAIFGVNRKSVAAFEHAVELTDNTKGFIDLLKNYPISTLADYVRPDFHAAGFAQSAYRIG